MMLRLLAALGTALLVLGISATARADNGFVAAGPGLDSEQAVMALTLLDSWRDKTNVTTARRVKLPKATVAAEREQPGEALTTYVERVWSQARVYRRPGGAEVILRAKF